jgi:hypothetical protein
MTSDDRSWTAEAPAESLTGNVEASTLVLRLGIAVNAVRAAQRFYLAVADADGPGGERDRFWAFLIASGFLNEALQVIRPKFPAVRALAESGGATEDQVHAVGELLSGRRPINQTLDRLRNQLAFHWDEGLVKEFVSNYSKPTVVWADGAGRSNGEMLYRASAAAVANLVLPPIENGERETDEQVRDRMKQLLVQLTEATAAVVALCERAIIGHLSDIGVSITPKAG